MKCFLPITPKRLELKINETSEIIRRLANWQLQQHTSTTEPLKMPSGSNSVHINAECALTLVRGCHSTSHGYWGTDCTCVFVMPQSIERCLLVYKALSSLTIGGHPARWRSSGTEFHLSYIECHMAHTVYIVIAQTVLHSALYESLF